MNSDDFNELESDQEQRRPVAIVLLGGLYLFFFMLTMSTFGHPYPLMGSVLTGKPAETVVFADSLICLYLFLGIMKRQYLTWHLLLAYNFFEIINTLINLKFITAADIEKFAGQSVDPNGLLVNNLSVVVAIGLLSLFVYRHRAYFNNRSNYLF